MLIRFVRSSVALVGIVVAVGLAGCSESGPKTVPVKGTLTIDGAPANDVTITFAPLDSSLPTASGPVKNGAFELFSGAQGKPGAVPGKYKVVLAASGGDAEAEAAAYESGQSGPPPEPQLPFPEKYQGAGTSDKEVEVTSGSNNIKIEI
jgi:hypothetical protein